MGNIKTVYKHEVIDSEGTVLQSKSITKQVKSVEHFVRVYLEDIGALTKCSKSEQSVVLASFKYIDFGTNEILINRLRRLEICAEAGLKIDSINSAICRLVQKNIFIKQGSSSYLLNPKLFFYGTDLERDKMFSLTINYEITDK